MNGVEIDPRITELHFITPISNIPSIIQRGILSNALIKSTHHLSVANNEVQERRDQVRVPNGLLLHQYANLYIDSRNPMLFTLMSNSDKDLCVLRIDTSVMRFPGVVLTSANAARDLVQFMSLSEAMARLNIDRIYAQYWVHDDDPIDTWMHKGEKCAEVLIPHKVDPPFIIGAYVPDSRTRDALLQLGFDKDISVRPDKFFNKRIGGR